jgi:hypothetical protein
VACGLAAAALSDQLELENDNGKGETTGQPPKPARCKDGGCLLCLSSHAGS